MVFYIIIRGPLGCGKSTISEKLAEIINAKHIAVDRVLDEHNLTEDKEEGYISQASFKQANEIIAPQAQKVLESGKSIIFDGNFYWQSQIEDLIGRLNFPHYVFTLKAPIEICIDRDAKRNKTHGEVAATVVHAKSTSFTYGTEIDVTKNIDECINEILSYLPKK